MQEPRKKNKHINQRNTRAGNPKSQKVSLCFDQETASKKYENNKNMFQTNEKKKLNKIKQTSMIKTEKMYKMFEFLKTMEEKITSSK